MSDVIIEKKNEVFLKLHCDPHILHLKLSRQNACPSIEASTGMERFAY